MKKISLGTLILWSVILGVATGLMFGEWCRNLELIGALFIASMQISVLPYIFVSLIQSFGSLNPSVAKLLAGRVLILLGMLWLVVFLLVGAAPLTFPAWESSSFFSPSLLENGAKVDYVQLFIPSNPFNSLANNVVPAVTIFSILCGIVLMGMPNKRLLLRLTEDASDVLLRLTMMLVRLTPLGIFAIVAQAAGTMQLEDLGRMEVYLAAFLVLGGLLFFLILPLALCALTSFRYWEILAISRNSMLTVLLTGNLFIVLPLLVENIEILCRRHDMLTQESRNMAKIIVPILFIVPCAGQLLDLLFIQFAGWFCNAPLGLGEFCELCGAGFLTMFGSAKVAIPFLLGMFHLPSDLFEIFVISSVITDNVKFTVEAFAVLILSTIFTAWMIKRIEWSWKRVVRAIAIMFTGIVLALVALHWGMTRFPAPEPQKNVLNAMQLHNPLPFEVFDRLPEAKNPTDVSEADGVLARIRRDKVLRVGFHPDAVPFAFFNDQGDLVGFDIDMAHRLARALHCRKVEFYPIHYETLAEALNQRQIDIVMSQVSITSDRLEQVDLSDAYMELSFVLLVPDYRKKELKNNPEIFASKRFRVAAMEGADYERLIQFDLPWRTLRLSHYSEFFSGEVKADALITTAENGSALTIMHPEYDLYIPQRQNKDLIAYAVPQGEEQFVDYLNFWLKLRKCNGELAEWYDFWIRGIDVKSHVPRWSILQDMILASRSPKDAEDGNLTGTK